MSARQALEQVSCRGRPIAYTSGAVTETKQEYVQIEKEMLATVFSLEKFHQYTYGRHVKIQSDHKLLESINATAFFPMSTPRLEEIQQDTENDEAFRILKNVILRVWPNTTVKYHHRLHSTSA